MPYEVDPTDGGNVSESLKDWFRQNVTTLFLDARDTPTQLVFEHLRRGVDFVLEGLRKGENVIVHCGRGISRSATVVIAALMVKDGLSYRDACAVCVFICLCYVYSLCTATTDFPWWLRNELASIPTSASSYSYVSSRSSIKTSTRSTPSYQKAPSASKRSSPCPSEKPWRTPRNAWIICSTTTPSARRRRGGRTSATSSRTAASTWGT